MEGKSDIVKALPGFLKKLHLNGCEWIHAVPILSCVHSYVGDYSR